MKSLHKSLRPGELMHFIPSFLSMFMFSFIIAFYLFNSYFCVSSCTSRLLCIGRERQTTAPPQFLHCQERSYTPFISVTSPSVPVHHTTQHSPTDKSASEIRAARQDWLLQPNKRNRNEQQTKCRGAVIDFGVDLLWDICLYLLRQFSFHFSSCVLELCFGLKHLLVLPWTCGEHLGSQVGVFWMGRVLVREGGGGGIGESKR